jgi:Zn-dependent protease with chaperone function
MSSASGPAPFELFSTHPSDERRIEQIREALPAAIEVYEQSLGSR